MFVEVSHPAAVVHVPARGRAERLSIAEVCTPVELRQASRDDLQLVVWNNGTPAVPRSTFRYGDALWSPFRALRGKALNHSDIDVWTFRSYLAKAPGHADLGTDLAGTPLATWGMAREKDIAFPPAPHPRGDAVDVDGSRSVSRDDRARAGRRLTEFLAERFLVVDNAVYERVSPLVTIQFDTSDGLCRLDFARNERISALEDVPVGPGLLASTMALAPAGCRMDTRKQVDLERWLALGIDDELDAMAPRKLVNSHAGCLRSDLETFVARSREKDAAHVDTARRIGAAMRGYEIDALTGSAGLDDIGKALRDMSEAVAFLKVQDMYRGSHRRAGLERAMDRVHIPASGAAAVPDGDLDALEAASRFGSPA